MQKSDKLHLLDHTSFEKIINNKLYQTKTIIKNSKYKRMKEDYNILSFIVNSLPQNISQKQRKKLKYPRLVINKRYPVKVLKRRGKRRECIKKRPTQLKKCILDHRQCKTDKKLNTESTTLDIFKRSDDPLISDNVRSIPTPDMTLPASNLFSNKFRSYCNNLTTERLKELTDNLLRELDGFKKRAYCKNPVKAVAHPRFVVGFRETLKYLMVNNKIKLCIIAPDIEICPIEGGLDDVITKIKKACENQQIPYLFSLRRRQLAYALYKQATVSCVGILDYDGAREIFADIMIELENARQGFISRMKEQNSPEQELNKITALLDTISLDEDKTLLTTNVPTSLLSNF